MRRRRKWSGALPHEGRASWPRRLAVVLGAIVVGVAAVAFVALELLDSRSGRKWVRPRVEALVSDAIPGSVRIGRVERATLARIVLRDVVVRDPAGREVLRIALLEGIPSKRGLARGAVAFERVVARGVSARLVPSESGVTLIDAFDEEEEEPGRPRGDPLEIRVDHFLVRRGEARLELEGAPIEFREVTIEGSVRSKEAFDLALARAAFRAEHGGVVLFEARELAGAYRTAPGARSELRALLAEADDRVRLRAARISPESDDEDAPASIEIDVDLERITPRVLEALGERDLARDLPRSARGTLEVRGTEERALFRATATVDGSPLRLDGMLAEGEARAQLCVDDLPLRRLHRGLPDAVVDGCARAAASGLGADVMPARLELRGGRIDGARLPDLRVEGTVDMARERVALGALDLPHAEPNGADRVLLEGEVGFSGDVDLRLALRGFAPSDDPALAALLGDARGTIDGEATLRTTSEPGTLRASVDASIASATAFGVHARRLALRASAEGTMDRPRFELEARAVGLEAGGVALRRARLRANGTPEAAVLRAVGHAPTGERAALRLHASREGAFVALEGEGSLGRAPEALVFRLARARFDPETGRAELGALRLAFGGGRAFVRGRVEGERIALRADLDRLPLDALVRAVAPDAGPLEGELSGEIRVGGTRARPTASIDLRAGDAAGFGIERAELALNGRVEPMEVRFSVAGNARQVGAVSIEARARWPEPMPLGEALRRARYELEASVDTANVDARFDAAWSEQGLLASGAAVGADGKGYAAIAVFSGATPRALDPGLDPLDFPLRVEAELFERRIAELPVRRPAWLDGDLRVAGEGRLEGGPGRPLEGTVQATLAGDLRPMASAEEVCDGVGTVALRLDGTLADDRARATLEAALAGDPRARITLDAALPLARMLRGRAGPEAVVADVTGAIEGLELDRVPVLCEMGTGTLDAELAGEGMGRRDAALRVVARSRAAQLGPDAVFDLNAELSARAGAATARLEIESDAGGRGLVEARLPFTWGGGLAPRVEGGALAVDARFDALSLEPFTAVSPLVRRDAGTLDGTVTVSGTIDAPIARGALALRGSAFVVPLFGQRLSDVDARVRFAPGHVVIEELRARDLDGRLTLRGDARLDGILPRAGTLEIETSRFPVRQEGVVTAVIDTRALGKVRRDDGGMRGDFRFERLSMRIPDESGRDVQDLAENPDIVYVDAYPEGWSPPERATDDDAPEDASGVTAALLPFELHIDASAPFWVRRSDLAVLLSAELDLVVTEEKSALTGEVRTLRGNVELAGARFDLDEGSIRFVGGETVDPLLDVRARANADTASEVRVAITGRLSAPVLSFADRSGQELTAGAALGCITGSQCGTGTPAGIGAEETEAFAQEARGQIASIASGLLTTMARQGLGEKLPQIAVTTGAGAEEVTVRAGFEANRLIPEVFRKFVRSLYIEGYVGTEAVAEEGAAPSGASSTSTRTTGGFLVEMRHPNRIVTRGRYEPPASWSLDMTWQP